MFYPTLNGSPVPPLTDASLAGKAPQACSSLANQDTGLQQQH